MGLKSHKTGVKAQLRERFPRAFRSFPSLLDARNASQAQREHTCAHIDGNVVFMAVPQAARTMDAYLAVVFSSLRTAVSTAKVTVVVFDDPAVLTEAKLQEQMRRDACKASSCSVPCSADLEARPLGDDYDKQYISAAPDVHALVGNRGSRLRFFDEVAVQVLDRLKAQIERWNAAGHDGGHVVFDGIDARGADRPIGQARAPDMVASSPEVAALFRRSAAIGEGDLKLASLGRAVRELARNKESLLASTKLALCTTIDTDSFCLELIEEARRGESEVTPVNTLLCMRERAQKRGTDEEVASFYLCCDISLLNSLLQRHMWGASHLLETSSARRRDAAKAGESRCNDRIDSNRLLTASRRLTCAGARFGTFGSLLRLRPERV